MERMAGALFDAQVDPNPHQVDAALFAARNPPSNGVIKRGDGAGEFADAREGKQA